MSKMSTFLDEGRAPVVIDVDYHAPTGKRIPVDVAGLSVTVSGITIGAVEIKDASSDTRATVTSDYGLEVDVTRVQGTVAISGNVVVTSLPSVVVSEVQGTTAISGFSSVYAFDLANSGHPAEIKAVLATADSIPASDYDPALAVGAVILGLNTEGNFDRIRGDALNGLNVYVTSIQDDVRSILNAGVSINRLAIDVSSNVNTLVAGIPNSQIRVLSCMILASGATNIAFRSDTASGTRLTGELTLDASGAGFVLDAPATREMYHFETDYSEALVLTVSPATYVGGYLNYYIDP